MKYLPQEGYKRIFVMTGYILITLIILAVGLKYLFVPLLPFGIAWVIAMMIRPAARNIARRTRLPYKLVSIAVILFVYLLIFGGISIIFGKLFGELRGLMDHIISDAAGAVGDVFDYIEGLSEKLPFLDAVENGETAEKIRNAVVSMINEAVDTASARLPKIVMDIASSLPGAILFGVVLVMATFYMGSEIDKINLMIVKMIPAPSRDKVFEAKKKLSAAGIKYLRAYLMILSITFAELLVGFLCLKIPYALALAAIIALIDILPILGVGTVLVPWAAVLLIRGETYTGVGLLIIFAVIWIIRQITEPKIVGESMGIPPLLTLAAMYAGFKLIGFGGLFVFPIIVILFKNLIDIGIFRTEKF